MTWPNWAAGTARGSGAIAERMVMHWEYLLFTARKPP
jgi:hypothetical protein